MRAMPLLAFLMIAAIGEAVAQSIPAPPVPSAPPPPGTIIERRTDETTLFTQTVCRGRPNGYYCGTGTNRQLMYQCVDGQIANELACPGGCNPATLSCAQEFGVKGIDPPKQ